MRILVNILFCSLGFLMGCGVSHSSNTPYTPPQPPGFILNDPECPRMDMGAIEPNPVFNGPTVPIGMGQQMIPTPIAGTAINIQIVSTGPQLRISSAFSSAVNATYLLDPSIYLIRNQIVVGRWTWYGSAVINAGQSRFIADSAEVVMLNWSGVEQIRTGFRDIYGCAGAQ